MKIILSLIAVAALSLAGCAGLQLGVSTDADGNTVIGATIPAPAEESSTPDDQ
jgi:ABC-type glycerol-3-phosphate transport system substrate-binding protein